MGGQRKNELSRFEGKQVDKSVCVYVCLVHGSPGKVLDACGEVALAVIVKQAGKITHTATQRAGGNAGVGEETEV
jgi:hypothetical protein